MTICWAWGISQSRQEQRCGPSLVVDHLHDSKAWYHDTTIDITTSKAKGPVFYRTNLCNWQLSTEDVQSVREYVSFPRHFKPKSVMTRLIPQAKPVIGKCAHDALQTPLRRSGVVNAKPIIVGIHATVPSRDPIKASIAPIDTI